ncbi:APC family permease [Acidocella sp.]|uniref:APC family permease n=1 Tax=Acidocella sp. TaxID=50710 RepID=UPI0026332B2D|nr:APC family permease [Acidocella sp.]
MSELRKDSLSFLEALGQSVANVSPTLTPALSVAVVAGMAGTASWLVFALCTVALVIVALNISKLAGRIPAAGSFFIYVSRSLGPVWGVLSGWAMLAAYIFTAMALTVATSLFAKTFLSSIGVSLGLPNAVFYLIISVLIWAFATRDVRISSRIGLTLEAISVTIILAVIAITLAHFHFKPDTTQISLSGASFGGITQAIVFGIFSFVGFESAASLGKETKNPETTIPKAIIWTAISSGLFFILSAYAITQGFNDNGAALGNSAAPIGDIASKIGTWMTAPVYFGATVSSFACALASLNAFGRMLFSLGRYQFVHNSMGLVHKTHKTPFLALTAGAVLNLVVCEAFAGQTETNTYGWYGTLASYGFIIVYLLCSIAAPVYLKRTGELKASHLVFGGLGVVFMLFALGGSVYPVPAAPYNYFPYAFGAYLLLGFAWFSFVKLRAPQVLASIEHDLEGAVIAAK